MSLDDVRNLFILVPSATEQRAIVAFLDEQTARLDALIAKVQQHIAVLREHRTALISAAVTGRIDVRGSGEDPCDTA